MFLNSKNLSICYSPHLAQALWIQQRPSAPIYGFSNQLIRVKSIITLPVTLGQDEIIVIVMVDFLVVDQLFVYNAIIGHP